MPGSANRITFKLITLLSILIFFVNGYAADECPHAFAESFYIVINQR
jgi:hypothetical protein